MAKKMPRTPAPEWRSRDRTTPHRRRSTTRETSSTRTPTTPNRLRSPILPIRRSSTPRRWSEMALHVGYQGATGCLPDAQPGARALMAWWLARFGGRGAINSGILNCRPVVGGTARSLHSEGRAADLGVRPINAAYGHEAASLLHAHSGELGIQCVIWSRGIWSGSQPNAGFRLYKGQNPHLDHLHVELSWPAARTLTQARIAQVLGGVIPVGGCSSSRTPTCAVRTCAGCRSRSQPGSRRSASGSTGPSGRRPTRRSRSSRGASTSPRTAMSAPGRGRLHRSRVRTETPAGSARCIPARQRAVADVRTRGPPRAWVQMDGVHSQGSRMGRWSGEVRDVAWT